MEGYVSVKESEYLDLLEDARFLRCLRNGGVDNWDWYDDACEEFHEGEKSGS